jgi:hypothetical protein
VRLVAKRRKRGKAKGPRFPRRTWAAGQSPRTEPPKKGKGASYDRADQDRVSRKEIGEGL